MNEKDLKRQIERLKPRIQDLEERKEKLSVHGYWDLGYYTGKLVVMEDWLDDKADLAERIFADLFSKVSFDGHNVSVWKTDLIEVAKKYGVEYKE